MSIVSIIVVITTIVIAIAFTIAITNAETILNTLLDKKYASFKKQFEKKGTLHSRNEVIIEAEKIIKERERYYIKHCAGFVADGDRRKIEKSIEQLNKIGRLLGHFGCEAKFVGLFDL